MKEKLIYLTGFMTSGKSTIGPILANTIGWNFFDLDELIEKSAGKKIVEIFEESGEKYFRDLESKILNNISSEKKAVISLGGGTIFNQDNYFLIRETGKLIYLKTSPQAIYLRIKNKINRPLFRELVLNETPQEEMLELIDEMLNKRSPLYEKSDIVMDTDSQSVGITVDKLVRKLTGYING